MKPRPTRILRTAAVASLLASAGSAAATTPGAFAAATGASVTLAPEGAERLEYTARPGSIVEGQVRLRNTSTQAHEMSLTAVDIGTGAFGGAMYGERRGKRTGGWLTLGAHSVTVGPRTTRIVRFRVRIPANAKPGSHYAGITAVNAQSVRAARAKKKPGRARKVVFHRIIRFALPVKVRVPGRTAPRVRFRGAKITADAAGTKAVVMLENTGRTVVRSAAVDLKITQGARTVAATRQPMQVFVPDSKAGYPVAWPGVPQEGEYRLVGTVKPAGAPAVKIDTKLTVSGKQAKKAQRSLAGRISPAARAGTSFVIWLALGGVSIAAAAFGFLFVCMRRRLKEATGSGGAIGG